MEKRGPVEFNHAISYVNKIKVSLSIVANVAVHCFFDLPIVRESGGTEWQACLQLAFILLFIHLGRNTSN